MSANDRLYVVPSSHEVRFGTFDDPDAKLVVSPAVMALLESDFPEAAREFRVDPVAEEFQRLVPMRWVSGFDPSNLENQ